MDMLAYISIQIIVSQTLVDDKPTKNSQPNLTVSNRRQTFVLWEGNNNQIGSETDGWCWYKSPIAVIQANQGDTACLVEPMRTL